MYENSGLGTIATATGTTSAVAAGGSTLPVTGTTSAFLALIAVASVVLGLMLCTVVAHRAQRG